MTATSPPSTPPATPRRARKEIDPDEYRMTIGEHLEELRTRVILGLIGFFVAAVVCLIIGKDRIVPFFCRPLVEALSHAKLDPQVFITEAQEAFMVYIEISLICALAIASPWVVYQLWKFVAAGLYPNERHYVTKYLPLSIILLISGMVFLYMYVLPISVEFFFKFGNEIPLDMPKIAVNPAAVPATQPVVQIPRYDGNPPNPVEGQVWLDLSENRLKMFLDNEIDVIHFGRSNLVAPIITLSKYIDMVVGMLLAFGISFQMPLVVLALVRLGIVEISSLKRMRRFVYFAIAIIAGCIVPDVATGMIALMIPLILLYEMGIFLAWYGQRGKGETEQ
jgi:sec-independent protein translocase protein TatC